MRVGVLIFPFIMQKGFWLPAIQLPKRAGLTRYLPAGRPPFPMLLRLTERWLLRCLLAPLLMELLLHLLFLPFGHHPLKPHNFHLCRLQASRLGINSSKVKQFHHL